jgi:hypothetical protein
LRVDGHDVRDDNRCGAGDGGELRRKGVSQAFAEPGTGGVDDADLDTVARGGELLGQ